MNIFRVITSNYIINVGFVAWFSAQVLKVLFTLLMTRKIVLERLVGAGGMPSSHSSLVVSVSIAMAKKLGYADPLFGLSFVFAAIVVYDAMGVRRAAGEHAKVLNKMIFEFPVFKQKKSDDKGEALEHWEDEPIVSKELKEFLGHTPIEVLGGGLLGILIAMFMPLA